MEKPPNTRTVVAANVRARLGWSRKSRAYLQERFGWSDRTAYNKLAGKTGFTADELQAVAELFRLDDPGPLFRIPENFDVSAVSGSAWNRRHAGQRHLSLVAA